jgi:hypothetical protein
VAQPKIPVGYEEIQGMVSLTPEELEKKIASGEIDDGFTLAAYGLWAAKTGRAV